MEAEKISYGERALWVLNDEYLYQKYMSETEADTDTGVMKWICLNKELIDSHIRRELKK